MDRLPVIDIAPLYQSNPAGWQAVARQIDQACREWGFFYISGHPIGAERIDALLAAARQFFAQPAAEKLKIDITRSNGQHRGYGAVAAEQTNPDEPCDLKEAFDMGLDLPPDHPDILTGKPLRGSNRHPPIPGWRELLESHFADLHQLSLTLMRALTIALGIDEDFFARCYQQPSSAFRLIHYPPRSTAQTPDQPGCGAHTDFGCVTLLYQDGAGGLQVQNLQGQWIDAPPIDGTFVVNIGDMLARWSNDRYRSTPHRVVSPAAGDRYSMPFFAQPHPDTPIACLPGCHNAANPPRYAPITCSQYMLERFAETYAYRRDPVAG